MKLHTSLTGDQIADAFRLMKLLGKITSDVHFTKYKPLGSNTHRYGYEIQLGTYDQHSLPRGYKDQNGHTLNVRRFKNTGNAGADLIWAATWDEWGWFIAHIFRLDPTAQWGWYENPEDFHNKTHGKFRNYPTVESADGTWVNTLHP